MTTLQKIRDLARDYAEAFDLGRRELAFDTGLGMAAIAIVVLNLVAIAAIAP